ncbi:MAG TPA: hypothetical protein VLI69_07870 [Gammaproteobacteria bacterium]|nr:hypothetical protein [Gammaproteobacteria bacterium]
MDNFSRRIGLTAIIPIQKDSINEALRNGTWTIVYELLCTDIEYGHTGYQVPEWRQKSAKNIRKIWIDFFKLAADSISWNPNKDISYLKEKFYAFKWNEFYDFIEFFAKLEDDYNRKSLIKNFNRIFERENSAYTFINEKIVEKISDSEIRAIEATKDLPKLPFEHIKNSSNLLFRRDNPDYRNSIKESVSALESFMRNLTDSDESLGDILREYDFGKFDMHPALKIAIKDFMTKLYGYSSDQSGIRHSLKENHKEIKKEEAWFVLVTISSLMNYIKNCAQKNI